MASLCRILDLNEFYKNLKKETEEANFCSVRIASVLKIYVLAPFVFFNKKEIRFRIHKEEET